MRVLKNLFAAGLAAYLSLLTPQVKAEPVRQTKVVQLYHSGRKTVKVPLEFVVDSEKVDSRYKVGLLICTPDWNKRKKNFSYYNLTEFSLVYFAHRKGDKVTKLEEKAYFVRFDHNLGRYSGKWRELKPVERDLWQQVQLKTLDFVAGKAFGMLDPTKQGLLYEGLKKLYEIGIEKAKAKDKRTLLTEIGKKYDVTEIPLWSVAGFPGTATARTFIFYVSDVKGTKFLVTVDIEQPRTRARGRLENVLLAVPTASAISATKEFYKIGYLLEHSEEFNGKIVKVKGYPGVFYDSRIVIRDPMTGEVASLYSLDLVEKKPPMEGLSIRNDREKIKQIAEEVENYKKILLVAEKKEKLVMCQSEATILKEGVIKQLKEVKAKGKFIAPHYLKVIELWLNNSITERPPAAGE